MSATGTETGLPAGTVNYERSISSTMTRDGRNYVERYIVQLTYPVPGTAWAARTHALLPTFGDAHGEDTYATVTRKVATGEPEDRQTWHVDVTYETPSAIWLPMNENPLLDDVKVQWSQATYTKVYEKDKDGNPVEDPAGQPYDPPITEDCHYLVLNLTRNEASFDPDTAEEYTDSVNSSPIVLYGKTIGARQGKLTQWTAENAYRNGTYYWIVHYQIEVFASKWDHIIGRFGLKYLTSGGDIRDTYPDDEPEVGGLEIRSPIKLDSDGTYQTDQSAAVGYDTWRLRKEKDWSTLSLDTGSYTGSVT